MKTYLVAIYKGDTFAAETMDELVDMVELDDLEPVEVRKIIAKDAGAARLFLGEFIDDPRIPRVKKSLMGFDSRRWSWEKVDCCLTGKDADLDECGQQGIEILGCGDSGVRWRLHVGKTVACEDVWLNDEGEDDSDEALMKRLELYADMAQEAVCGCDIPGEWDGSDWYLKTSVDGLTTWSLMEPNSKAIDFAETAEQIVEDALKAAEPIGAELSLLDTQLNMLAGWTTRDAEHNQVACDPGRPGPEAAWLTAERRLLTEFTDPEGNHYILSEDKRSWNCADGDLSMEASDAADSWPIDCLSGDRAAGNMSVRAPD